MSITAGNIQLPNRAARHPFWNLQTLADRHKVRGADPAPYCQVCTILLRTWTQWVDVGKAGFFGSMYISSSLDQEPSYKSLVRPSLLPYLSCWPFAGESEEPVCLSALHLQIQYTLNPLLELPPPRFGQPLHSPPGDRRRLCRLLGR